MYLYGFVSGHLAPMEISNIESPATIIFLGFLRCLVSAFFKHFRCYRLLYCTIGFHNSSIPVSLAQACHLNWLTSLKARRARRPKEAKIEWQEASTNNKREIFARRAMVDQAREGLCYQRKRNLTFWST